MERLANNKVLISAAAGIVGVAALYFARRGCGSCCRGKPVAAAAVKKLDAIVISGPSGVGKGTLIQRLLAAYPDQFGFSVSHTTRDPRTGEVDGTHYHFIAKDNIQKMIANNEFLESCNVHGNIYGTSKAALADVTAQGKVAIIEMDVQGAQLLKTRQGALNFHYMFVTAPSMEELETRIRKRGADNDEKVKIRLETARKEYEFLQSSPEFFNTILANNNVEEAYEKLVALLVSLGVPLKN
ncbi:guanylate cyclase-like protein, putative [Bodo saltans]|uniref:guanylate kinase n=1 Tax=Bodo saltans TaxID=75058 RepID=A0A0S4IU78_BODSA|nr:guanylate cyclase-like protein, putative [Bodo saltans]|eukprot:CUF94486.1 guanylate cyclase-like protein, putative [Bodo saltans]